MTEKQYEYIYSLYRGVVCVDKYCIKLHLEDVKNEILKLSNNVAQQFIKCGKLYKEWRELHDARTLIEISDYNDIDSKLEIDKEIDKTFKKLKKEEKELIKMLPEEVLL